jgi:hypothetical protein
MSIVENFVDGVDIMLLRILLIRLKSAVGVVMIPS